MMRTAKSLYLEGLSSLKGISENASLDSLILLGFILKITREEYWRNPEQEVTEEQAGEFNRLIVLRAKREPIAYLTHEKEFWGLKFFVDHRVLIPRPDTEILVETALELIKGHPSIRDVFDIGTGSGAIGLSVCASTPPTVNVHLVDISPDALKVARLNKQHLYLSEVSTHLGSLLSPWETLPASSLILANLPYLTEEETREKDLSYPSEPHLALIGGGEDGLNLIEELLDQIKAKQKAPTWVILESSSWQIPLISHTMKEKGFNHISIRQDLSGQDRIILARL